MRESEVSVQINRSVYFDNVRITAEKAVDNRLPTTPSATAIHEAKHVVAAWKNGTGTESVTIIPGPGFKGLTKLHRFDAVAAAAPHATGSSGGSYDIFLIGAMGHDVGAASRAASSIIRNNSDKVSAVASRLEDKKTLFAHDIREAMESTEQKKEKVTIFVEHQDGHVDKIANQTAEQGIVIFHKAWAKKSHVNVATKQKEVALAA